MKKFLKYAASIIVLGLAVVVGLVMVFSTKERPIPEQLVGFSQTSLAVAHRQVELPVFVWYPSNDKIAPELIGQNALFYGFHAMRDAAGTGDNLPVVVISHGSGGNAIGLGWLAVELASRGMIVVATNHPGTTSRDSLQDKTVQVWERPQDITEILNALPNILPQDVVADPNRIAALGFSLGGYSVLSLAGVEVSKSKFIEYCDTYPDKLDCGWFNAGGLDFNAIDAAKYEQSNLDARVQTIVAVDAALPRAVKDGMMAKLSVPSLFVQLGDTDTIAEGMRWDDNIKSAPNATYEIVPDTYHFAFLSECSGMGKFIIGVSGDDNICSDKGTRSRGIVHDELREIIGDFLSKELNPAGGN